jgi:hypothetical protein
MPLPRRVPTPPARLLGVLAILTLLTGCSHGLYETRMIAPASSDGQPCLGRCDLAKTQCIQRQETRERACAQWYTEAKQEYDTCSAGGRAAARCRAPVACLGADLGICDQEYEGCFTACGGQVERRLRPWPGTQPAAADTPPVAAKTGQSGN